MFRPAPSLAPPSMAALLLLPLCVLADGALFWPAACLVAIGAAITKRPGAMLVWYGLAIGFDANALVLAPFVVALCFRLRAGWRTVSLAPAFALAMLLARSHGGLPDLALWDDIAVTSGAPTLWAIVHIVPGLGELPLAGLALTTMLGACVTYGAWASGCSLRRTALLDTALLGAMLPVLLPAVGTRAFLLASALAVMLAVLDPQPRRWWVAGLTVAATALGWPGLAIATPCAAVAMLAAALLHARPLLGRAANDNPRMPSLPRTKPLPS